MPGQPQQPECLTADTGGAFFFGLSPNPNAGATWIIFRAIPFLEIGRLPSKAQARRLCSFLNRVRSEPPRRRI